MLRCSKFLTLLLLLSPAVGFMRGVPNGEPPAFTPVPELNADAPLDCTQFRVKRVPSSRCAIDCQPF